MKPIYHTRLLATSGSDGKPPNEAACYMMAIRLLDIELSDIKNSQHHQHSAARLASRYHGGPMTCRNLVRFGAFKCILR